MQLTLDNSDGNIIRSYRPGELRLNNDVFHDNLIISADKIITDWQPAATQAMVLQDFQLALELKPEIILFGSGPQQQFPASALMVSIMQQGIAIEVMDTAAACRTFNVLVGEYRAVVAALLLN
jgi:uncharacterized protein